MENPIKMDDLVVPLFLETPIYVYSKYREKTPLIQQLQDLFDGSASWWSVG